MNKSFYEHLTTLIIFMSGAFLLYFISLQYPFFVFDDSTHITLNQRVLELSLENFFWFWDNSKTPIIFNFWQLQTLLFGAENPTGFRIVSLLLHGINSFLVCYWLMLLLKYFIPQKQYTSFQYSIPALTGGLFFLIHPIHIESVVWISAQKDLLTFTFALSSFIFYLKTQEKDLRFVYYSALSFVLFCAGVLTKPSILPLCLVYIWLDLTLFSTALSKILSRYFHYALLGLSISFLYFKSLQNFGFQQSVLSKILVALDAIRLTLFNILSPHNLKFDYQRTVSVIHQ